MAELSVIIPTFNEVDTITRTVHTIDQVLKEHHIDGEILIVDDQSIDGTIEKVRELQAHLTSLHLIVREKDHGLSQSVVEGFRRSGSPFILVMDADLSHPPSLIPDLLEHLRKGADLAIGSRYMKGGGIEDWPLNRRVISFGATVLGRILLPQITDPVSGFFALRREVVADAPLRPRGYKILLEVLGKGRWTTVVEVPFHFINRGVGESKLKHSTMAAYVDQVLSTIAFTLHHRDNAVWREWVTAAKFGLVGLSGIVVNMGLLYLMSAVLGLFYMVSGLIAIECSIINNFVWNDLWTFRHRTERSSSRGSRCLSFHLISFGGLLINFTLLVTLTEVGRVYYLTSNLIGILVAFVWNFFLNRTITWK